MSVVRRWLRVGGEAAAPAVAALVTAFAAAACSFSSDGVARDATRNDATSLDGRRSDGPIGDARSDAAPVDAAPRRTRLGLVLRYDFNEAGGATVVQDTSGVEPQRNLQVIASINQAPIFDGESLTTTGSTALIDEVANLSAGAKIVDACMLGTITIEAWITQDTGSIASGRIITLTKSDDVNANNFLVGSFTGSAATAAAVLRTSATTTAGLTLGLANGIVAATPQLMVARYNGTELKLQTLIGPTTDAGDAVATVPLTGTFANWNRSYKMVLLNSPEYSNSSFRPWRGTISSLAVYCRSLSDTEVAHDRLLGSESL